MSTDLTDLEARLDRMESLAACQRLATDYSYGFDGEDPAIIRSIFHEDAVFDLGDPFGRHVGHTEIVKAAGGFWQAMPHMHHNMTNMAIDLEGDRGTGNINLLCLVTHTDEGQVLISGNYADVYERRNGRWAIAERVFTMHFWGPLAGWQATMGTEAVASPSVS